MTSTKSHPPLLHTYTAPSGPIAIPFGLPPFSEITSTPPFGWIRWTVRRRSSTHNRVPSSIAIGPSGKKSPDATSVVSGVCTGAGNHRARARVNLALLEEQLRYRFGIAAFG